MSGQLWESFQWRRPFGGWWGCAEEDSRELGRPQCSRLGGLKTREREVPTWLKVWSVISEKFHYTPKVTKIHIPAHPKQDPETGGHQPLKTEVHALRYPLRQKASLTHLWLSNSKRWRPLKWCLQTSEGKDLWFLIISSGAKEVSRPTVWLLSYCCEEIP